MLKATDLVNGLANFKGLDAKSNQQAANYLATTTPFMLGSMENYCSEVSVSCDPFLKCS